MFLFVKSGFVKMQPNCVTSSLSFSGRIDSDSGNTIVSRPVLGILNDGEIMQADKTRHNLILGIDGGASKTVAILCDADGTMLGRVQVGGSNKQVSGVDATLATLLQAIDAVFADAQIARQTVGAACFGLSGVDRPADHQLIQRWADTNQITRWLSVVNDAQLVVAAGTPDGYGIGLICGTGSIAIGRNIHGQYSRAGGWGYLLGDEGSGYDISLKALRAACQAADGRGTGAILLAALLQMWELSSADQLIPYVYNQPDPRTILAEIPPLVSRLALEGEPICVRILHEAGADLADAIIAAADQIGLRHTIPLALAGSVVLKTPMLQAAMCETLASRGRPADPVIMVEDPALGAIRLARDLLAIHVEVL
jgi:N-acetylmuramic acid 6-phosphate etherase